MNKTKIHKIYFYISYFAISAINLYALISIYDCYYNLFHGRGGLATLIGFEIEGVTGGLMHPFLVAILFFGDLFIVYPVLTVSFLFILKRNLIINNILFFLSACRLAYLITYVSNFGIIDIKITKALFITGYTFAFILYEIKYQKRQSQKHPPYADPDSHDTSLILSRDRRSKIKTGIAIVFIVLLTGLIILGPRSETGKMLAGEANRRLASIAAVIAPTEYTCRKVKDAKYFEGNIRYAESMANNAVIKACKTATSWANCEELSKEGVTAIFEKSFKEVGINEACVPLYTDYFMKFMAYVHASEYLDQ